MKTINDFKIINEVAVLDGVAYAEEAKIVEEYLINNKEVKYVSVLSKDGRYFELKNCKLVLSNEERFINPYFIKKSNLICDELDSKVSKQKKLEPILNVSNIELDQKFYYLEERLGKLYSLMNEITKLLKSYYDFKN